LALRKRLKSSSGFVSPHLVHAFSVTREAYQARRAFLRRWDDIAGIRVEIVASWALEVHGLRYSLYAARFTAFKVRR